MSMTLPSQTLPSRTPLSRPAEPAARRDLGRLYRAIGIGAVAAALPYRGDVKNDAYAPVRPRTANATAVDERTR
jgi:hypothetical protein